MGNQLIKIQPAGKKGALATFNPTPQPASLGDTITWQNQDLIQHWPNPTTGPAWFNQAINPGVTTLPISVTQNTNYSCKLHSAETGSIQMGGAPQIVRLVIVAGSLPNARIKANDSVFWFNDTSDTYQLFPIDPKTGKQLIDPATGNPVFWGVPPTLLGPKQQSSQVVFPKSGTFPYECKRHPGQKGTIIVL